MRSVRNAAPRYTASRSDSTGCVGMRLAELQLRIVWEEILKRFERIEVVGEPKRVYSSFVRGIESLPVRIPS